MNEQHTPGPWRWEEDVTDRSDMPRLVGLSGEVCNFGNCEQYYPTEGEPPSDADMALIAAAPDLLAALSELLSQVQQADTYEGGDIKAYEASIKQARAAIARATTHGAQP